MSPASRRAFFVSCVFFCSKRFSLQFINTLAYVTSNELCRILSLLFVCGNEVWRSNGDRTKLPAPLYLTTNTINLGSRLESVCFISL